MVLYSIHVRTRKATHVPAAGKHKVGGTKSESDLCILQAPHGDNGIPGLRGLPLELRLGVFQPLLHTHIAFSKLLPHRNGILGT